MWLMVGPVAPLPGPIMRQYQRLRDEGDGHPLEAISVSVPRCCGRLERMPPWAAGGTLVLCLLILPGGRGQWGRKFRAAAAWDTDQGHFGKPDILSLDRTGASMVSDVRPTRKRTVKIPWATNLRWRELSAQHVKRLKRWL